MKCPKCGYLGFESVDRCRNCGYDFSLAPSYNLPDLPIRPDEPEMDAMDELALTDSAAAGDSLDTSFTAEVPGPRPATPRPEPASPTPLFDEGPGFDLDAGLDEGLDVVAPPPSVHRRADRVSDTPLITQASAPRAPLAVRRATPEVPRLRSSRTPMLDMAAADVDDAFTPAMTPAIRARTGDWAEPLLEPEPVQAAPLVARATAVAIDAVILAAVDVIVVYFTLQILGIGANDVNVLPRGPFITFLFLLNGGYLIAFNAGGQTLGKMVTGIKVVAARPDESVNLGQAIVRTAVWLLLAMPAGLGFLTAVFSRDSRGLHDHAAGTRVIRASAI